jgi:hypothetical protein
MLPSSLVLQKHLRTPPGNGSSADDEISRRKFRKWLGLKIVVFSWAFRIVEVKCRLSRLEHKLRSV